MDPIVRRPAQADLPENDPVSFDQGVLQWISKNCPDWNKANVRKTYMIPPTFPDINKKKNERGQLTEKHVFDILQEFGEKTKQSMFVVHSFEFREVLDNCPDGETDFVIIHQTLGVIFFQVKARIKTCHVYGSAMLQLNKDQVAMASFLERHKLYLGKHGTTVEAELKKCQGFVVMPNCPRDKALGKEGCFREDIQSVAAFKKWWQEKVHRTEVFSDREMYKLMAIGFVGTRVTTGSWLLKDVIDETHKRIATLWTMDQLSIMTQNEPKQYIAGPAGSGKTLLLLEKAQQVAVNLKANERILIMCFNKPLSRYLDSMADNFPNAEQIVVKTFVSILKEIKGPDWKALPVNDREERNLVFDCVKRLQVNSDPRFKYEHVFVDEGQDMYGLWENLVNLLHHDVVGSNEERRYKWVFFDNSQSVYFGSQNYMPQKTVDNTMHQVVRNTFNIFECSRKFLSSDVAAELDHGIVGKQVKWIDSLPTITFHISPSDVLEKGTELVMQEIADLDSKSVGRSDIVVLTKDVKERDEVCKIFKNGYNILTQDAEEAIRPPNKPAITVDSIRRFKGLERKVVILFDPPIDEESSVMMDLNYVAMSRSFCYLVIVTSQYKRQKYDEKFAPKESPSRKRKQKSGKFSPKKPRKETD